MAEYGSMFLVSGLAAILFFGGWNGPIPIFTASGLADQDSAWWYIARTAGVANFIGKAVVGVTVMMWVRWTLPRLRIDQVMTTCLKYCVPLAAICFIGAVAYQLSGLPTGNDLAPLHKEGMAVERETWLADQLKVEQAAAEASAKTDFSLALRTQGAAP